MEYDSELFTKPSDDQLIEQFNLQAEYIIRNRKKIIEDYIKVWLAVNMPDEADYAWYINNCQLSIVTTPNFPEREIYYMHFKHKPTEDRDV
jgi:hypothetical protein